MARKEKERLNYKNKPKITAHTMCFSLCTFNKEHKCFKLLLQRPEIQKISVKEQKIIATLSYLVKHRMYACIKLLTEISKEKGWKFDWDPIKWAQADGDNEDGDSINAGLFHLWVEIISLIDWCRNEAWRICRDIIDVGWFDVKHKESYASMSAVLVYAATLIGYDKASSKQCNNFKLFQLLLEKLTTAELFTMTDDYGRNVIAFCQLRHKTDFIDYMKLTNKLNRLNSNCKWNMTDEMIHNVCEKYQTIEEINDAILNGNRSKLSRIFTGLRIGSATGGSKLSVGDVINCVGYTRDTASLGTPFVNCIAALNDCNIKQTKKEYLNTASVKCFKQSIAQRRFDPSFRLTYYDASQLCLSNGLFTCFELIKAKLANTKHAAYVDMHPQMWINGKNTLTWVMQEEGSFEAFEMLFNHIRQTKPNWLRDGVYDMNKLLIYCAACGEKSYNAEKDWHDPVTLTGHDLENTNNYKIFCLLLKYIY